MSIWLLVLKIGSWQDLFFHVSNDLGRRHRLLWFCKTAHLSCCMNAASSYKKIRSRASQPTSLLRNTRYMTLFYVASLLILCSQNWVTWGRLTWAWSHNDVKTMLKAPSHWCHGFSFFAYLQVHRLNRGTQSQYFNAIVAQERQCCFWGAIVGFSLQHVLICEAK